MTAWEKIFVTYVVHIELISITYLGKTNSHNKSVKKLSNRLAEGIDNSEKKFLDDYKLTEKLL